MHNSPPIRSHPAHPHTPPPHAPRPTWPYAHRLHEAQPEDYPSAPVTPSPTGPANMPEPSPILEHPEYTAPPSPVAQPAQQDNAPVQSARERNDSLPPLPAEAEASAVPTAVRLPDPAASATSRHLRIPPPIVAPTPAFARTVMSADTTPPVSARAAVTPVAGASHQHQGGSSSDESPVSDHVPLHRPATAQAHLRSGHHRASGSVTHASQGSEAIMHPVRTLSYNSAAGRSRRSDRPDRPRSAGVTGVGPDPYGRALDYVVPTAPMENGGEKRDSKMGLSMTSARENNVKDRLGPTIKHAEEARMAAKRKARFSGYALNVCIGAQVVLGAITTGVAAASTTSRSSTSVGIPILGGLSTLAASYLARARGSGEPEKSIVRAHDLDHFIRDAEAFLLDHGHLTGIEYDAQVQRYRARFEEIMGHNPGKNGVQPTPKDLEAGFGPRATSSDGHSQVPLMQSVYAASGHQGQMPVSPMGQGPPMPGGYFPSAAQALNPLSQQAAQALSPLSQQAMGYVNTGAQQAMGYVNSGAQQAMGYINSGAQQAAQALAPLSQQAMGYANTGAQIGAALQAPPMAHVPPTATAGYPVSQPIPTPTPLSTAMR